MSQRERDRERERERENERERMRERGGWDLLEASSASWSLGITDEGFFKVQSSIHQLKKQVAMARQ